VACGFQTEKNRSEETSKNMLDLKQENTNTPKNARNPPLHSRNAPKCLGKETQFTSQLSQRRSEGSSRKSMKEFASTEPFSTVKGATIEIIPKPSNPQKQETPKESALAKASKVLK